MANIKVSELPSATSFEDEDYVMIIQSNTSKKITKKNMYGNYKYSSNEEIIGKWLNDKPLYRKTIFISALPSDATIGEYDTGISNIEQVVNMYGQYQGIVFGVMTTRCINFYMPMSEQETISTYLGNNGTKIKIAVASNKSDFSGYVTIEYTKTTD